jgi:hypothetical protein
MTVIVTWPGRDKPSPYKKHGPVGATLVVARFGRGNHDPANMVLWDFAVAPDVGW